MDPKFIKSPNYTAGRAGFTPIAIVIHIMEGSLDGTDSWFQNPSSKVSAHYGIGKKGNVHQYVSENDTAWHAGRVYQPSWKLIKPIDNEPNSYHNPNYYTIGIEHEGNEQTDWTDEMYQASSILIKEISKKWNIPLDRDHVIGHHEIYALKECPGQKVDLNKLIFQASGVLPVQKIMTIDRVAGGGKVTTQSNIRIRRSPDTTQPSIATVPSGVQLAFDGYTTQGEPIDGNNKWFYTNEGNWFWSGAVKKN